MMMLMITMMITMIIQMKTLKKLITPNGGNFNLLYVNHIEDVKKENVFTRGIFENKLNLNIIRF